MHISVPSTALVALLLASIAVRTAAAEAVGDVVTALAPPGHQAYQEAVARSRWHGHDDGRQAPLRAQPLRRDSRRSETEPTVAKTSHQCDLEGLVAQQGEALVAHIRAIDFDCISELFNRAPARVRLAAFQETNMVVVARAALTMVTAYDGFNHMPSLANLLYYLQAGVYVEFYQDTDELRWSSAVDEAKVAVIDAFVASSHFYNDNEATGLVAQRVFPLMDARGLRLQYLAAIWDWLSRWTPIRAESYAQRNAASAAFVLVFASHFEQGFTAAVTDLTPMVLRDFALGDWMVGTDAEGLAANGARELARFLAHPDLPFYDEVRAGVRQVFDHYEPLGHGASIWVAGATSALHYTDCSEYGICEQVAGLESAVLSVEHRCSTGVHIRGQDLDERQIADACATLRQLEAIFHRRLKTGRQPVADDFTTHYEAVAFADYDNYATYSPLFFGNATNNGGLYLEGDPSQSGNVSRHLGYVADWLPDQPIWNLAHEYVHHLDGRFNLKGHLRSIASVRTRPSGGSKVWRSISLVAKTTRMPSHSRVPARCHLTKYSRHLRRRRRAHLSMVLSGHSVHIRAAAKRSRPVAQLLARRRLRRLFAPHQRRCRNQKRRCMAQLVAGSGGASISRCRIPSAFRGRERSRRSMARQREPWWMSGAGKERATP